MGHPSVFARELDSPLARPMAVTTRPHVATRTVPWDGDAVCGPSSHAAAQPP